MGRQDSRALEPQPGQHKTSWECWRQAMLGELTSTKRMGVSSLPVTWLSIRKRENLELCTPSPQIGPQIGDEPLLLLEVEIRMRKRGEESPGIFTVTEAAPDGRNVRSGQEVFPNLQLLKRTVLYLAYLTLGEYHLTPFPPLDNRINFSDNYVMNRNHHYFLDSIFSFKTAEKQKSWNLFPVTLFKLSKYFISEPNSSLTK